MSTPKIKVLHLFVTLPVGGAEDLLASIITGLDPARFLPEVACLEGAGPVGEELRRRGHQVSTLDLDIKRDSMLTIVSRVRRFLKARQSPDSPYPSLPSQSLWPPGRSGIGVKRRRRLHP